MSGYVSHISVNNYSIRVVPRVNYFQKQVGAKNWKRRNRDKNFQNHEIIGKHSISSKQLKLKGNKEKYIYLNRYANESFFFQNFRSLFLTISSAIVMGLVRN